ncbi:hypothetical protein CSKR_104371 [Clonorchis sinensis]|uniref:Uncharacterized protein n=1 Tax=Clonorchis sinensis TaxID=79923 RepID=A0A419QDK5_CLOSI|nr:hypothetical protein CSKR_104371 [Clonorchis sinensis]
MYKERQPQLRLGLNGKRYDELLTMYVTSSKLSGNYTEPAMADLEAKFSVPIFWVRSVQTKHSTRNANCCELNVTRKTVKEELGIHSLTDKHEPECIRIRGGISALKSSYVPSAALDGQWNRKPCLLSQREILTFPSHARKYWRSS